jgi:hypothetical protein
VVVVVFVLPVHWVPLATRVFIVTAITVCVTYPSAGVVVVLLARVFGFLPTSIAVVVTLDANAVITVRVAALVGAGNCRSRQQRCPTQTQ